MENKRSEIQECRREVQALTQRLNALSARLDALDRPELPEPQLQTLAEIDTRPQENPAAQTVPPQPPAESSGEGAKKSADLENTVGKNLFAILASLLVLLGVSVFISTIYEYIPEFVKILAIYIFGFVLLGWGLLVYRKNKNNFWLGVASCGLAELLVSVITSHTYFEVLSLPAAFVLILIWIMGSFWLTRFQPTVFKTIGYIGFTISIMLGQSLLTDRDLPVYLTLLGAYVLLSVFFMVTNRSHVKMNTALAFLNVLNLCQFLNMRWYLPENIRWISGLVAGGILAVYHVVYLYRGRLHKDAYAFFSIISLGILALFLTVYDPEIMVPAILFAAFGLWYFNAAVEVSRNCRMFYSGVAALSLFLLAYPALARSREMMLWFMGFAAVAYGLYFLTKKRDAAWIGFVCFLIFYLYAGRDTDLYAVGTLAAALAFLVLNSSGLIRKDSALGTAWYVLIFCIAHTVKARFQSALFDYVEIIRDARTISDSIFYLLLTLINTFFLHRALRDRERILRITGEGVALMVLQAILLINCMDAVDSGIWYVTLMGVAGSLLIVSYSLHYSFMTRGSDDTLMVWHFIKFTLYCGVVLAMLDSPSILMNISLLLIAIGAIVLGFRLGHKSVRIYGLILSLLDVVCLVLFNIDYSNSLQLAGGIVLCGALCFVISFIYSRISKAARTNRENT